MSKRIFLEEQLRELREKVEDELLSENIDNEKLLKLSTELDELIVLYMKSS